MANLNLEEILEQFQNGPRRYDEDPAFKAVVDSLKMGLGVYGVLDHVLAESTRIKEMHRSLIFKHTALNSQIEMQEQHISKFNERYDAQLEEIQKLKDEAASWKDAHKGLQELVDKYAPGI